MAGRLHWLWEHCASTKCVNTDKVISSKDELGSYIALDFNLAYRCGSFHVLSPDGYNSVANE
jgi:hypothetical protein